MNFVLSRIWRISITVGVAVVGFSLLVAGAIMIVTPGPGWACIFAGLAVLATEFVWARRLLQKAKDTAVSARDKVMGRNSTQPAASSNPYEPPQQ